jgi:hypothetical protein
MPGRAIMPAVLVCQRLVREWVMDCISLAEASRRCGRAARTLSDAIYSGRIDASAWPLVAGRRLVPEVALPAIRRVLREDAAGGGRDRRS